MAGHGSGATTGEYVVRVIDTDKGLEAVSAQWTALATRAAQPNVFATAEWTRAAWNHRVSPGGGRSRLHVLVVERGDTIVAVAPLRLSEVTRFGVTIRKLEFTDSDLADYSDI